jgi:hypothetical protein
VVAKTTTAKRATKLERKYNNLFTRMLDRWEVYLRFAHDPRVPFDNNAAQQTIRMPKLRVKVSGSLRTVEGAQDFAAIRSYTATAVRVARTCSMSSSGQPTAGPRSGALSASTTQLYPESA